MACGDSVSNSKVMVSSSKIEDDDRGSRVDSELLIWGGGGRWFVVGIEAIMGVGSERRLHTNKMKVNRES